MQQLNNCHVAERPQNMKLDTFEIWKYEISSTEYVLFLVLCVSSNIVSVVFALTIAVHTY